MDFSNLEADPCMWFLSGLVVIVIVTDICLLSWYESIAFVRGIIFFGGLLTYHCKVFAVRYVR